MLELDPFGESVRSKYYWKSGTAVAIGTGQGSFGTITAKGKFEKWYKYWQSGLRGPKKLGKGKWHHMKQTDHSWEALIPVNCGCKNQKATLTVIDKPYDNEAPTGGGSGIGFPLPGRTGVWVGGSTKYDIRIGGKKTAIEGEEGSVSMEVTVEAYLIEGFGWSGSVSFAGMSTAFPIYSSKKVLVTNTTNTVTVTCTLNKDDDGVKLTFKH